MFSTLFLGCLIVVVNMVVQVAAVVVMLRFLARKSAAGGLNSGIGTDMAVISVVLMVLFSGHLVQIGIWAGLFVYLNEFNEYATAFYHSTVNFTSLGYGDITMSENWRLLGAVEAGNGVLLFGLTTGTIMSVMAKLYDKHRDRIAV